MNRQIANYALWSVEDEPGTPAHGKRYVLTPGYCQSFVFRVLHYRYDGIYNSYLAASANSAMTKWARSQWAVTPIRSWTETELGDILYWRYAPHGHTAIRTWGNRVAENSTTSIGRVRGGLGYRPLRGLKLPDLVVRLPEL